MLLRAVLLTIVNRVRYSLVIVWARACCVVAWFGWRLVFAGAAGLRGAFNYLSRRAGSWRIDSVEFLPALLSRRRAGDWGFRVSVLSSSCVRGCWALWRVEEGCMSALCPWSCTAGGVTKSGEGESDEGVGGE